MNICKLCRYEWKPRKKKKSKWCPNCNSEKWDVGIGLLIKCEVCSKTPLSAHIHHKDGNHNNNNPKNLIMICNSCHNVIHHGFGKHNKRSRNYFDGRINSMIHKNDEFSNYVIRNKLIKLRNYWFIKKNI